MNPIKPTEAVEKTCPFMSRKLINGSGSVLFSDIKCIAQKCMSWKFTSPTSDVGVCCLLTK